jgi:hypothetical protein
VEPAHVAKISERLPMMRGVTSCIIGWGKRSVHPVIRTHGEPGATSVSHHIKTLPEACLISFGKEDGSHLYTVNPVVLNLYTKQIKGITAYSAKTQRLRRKGKNAAFAQEVQSAN